MEGQGRPVLVVGGTGFLGVQVVSALLSRGKRVRALVRPGSDASGLRETGVEVAGGDMMDPSSLEELGVPFVSLRPGAFLDQMTPVLGRNLPKGRLWYVGSREVRMTYVLSGDVARHLAEAVDAPGVEGERIAIGWERPVSANELALLAGGVLGREVRVRAIPWWGLSPALWVAGRFNGQIDDFRAMFGYFQTGRYVVDPVRQSEVFGAVPTVEEGVRRWLEGASLAPAGAGAAVSGADSKGRP